MLKKRIIPSLLISGYSLVKGSNFNNWRTVGVPLQSVKIYNERSVDELFIFDIDVSKKKNIIDFERIRLLTSNCFMPVTYGGGIKSLDEREKILKSGADKVCINTHALKNYAFIKNACSMFGSQAISISIDCKYENNQFNIYSHSGSKKNNEILINHLDQVQNCGVGEIVINSIDNDGTLSKPNYELLNFVKDKINCPLIFSGGFKEKEDILRVIKDNKVSGVSISSLFLFTEITPLEIKKFLKKNNVPIRI